MLFFSLPSLEDASLDLASDLVPAKRRKLRKAADVKRATDEAVAEEATRPVETASAGPTEEVPQGEAAAPQAEAAVPQAEEATPSPEAFAPPPEPTVLEALEERAVSPPRAPNPPRAATPSREPNPPCEPTPPREPTPACVLTPLA